MEQKQGYKDIQERFPQKSAEINEAVFSVLGDQIMGLVGANNRQRLAIETYRTAMSKVNAREVITAQEMALLEYLPWAVIGRLIGITGAQRLREEPELMEYRVQILEKLGWGETESTRQVGQGLDEMLIRLEGNSRVELKTLFRDVIEINTALFPNTADLD